MINDNRMIYPPIPELTEKGKFNVYAKYKGIDVSVGEETNILSYNDALEISEYAIPAMQWACGAGLINGNDDETVGEKKS